jgi:CRP/FNR family cyclic AMP-dependent transcriptional regulator
MDAGALGKVFADGEEIVRQGDEGNCMYVIQAGEVDVVRDDGGGEVRLAVLGEGDVFGEMALFDREARSATVRARGEARVLTLDRKTFMRRVHEDPSVAFRILQRMSHRIRQLNEEVVRLKADCGQSEK